MSMITVTPIPVFEMIVESTSRETVWEIGQKP